MAKKKPTPKKPAKKAPKKPAAKPKIAPPAGASAALEAMGFFRGEYDWEADRDVPALGGRVRLLVDHTGGVVAPVQIRALELLLETETDLRAPALKAAYEWLLGWMEQYRQRHPNFKGKPVSERTFNRATAISEVAFPSPGRAETDPPLRFRANVYWNEDDGHAWAANYEHQKGKWVLVSCERV